MRWRPIAEYPLPGEFEFGPDALLAWPNEASKTGWSYGVGGSSAFPDYGSDDPDAITHRFMVQEWEVFPTHFAVLTIPLNA